MKGLWSRFKRSRGRTREVVRQGQELSNETTLDFTMDELREFLEADTLDVQADPEFKERLRRTLWDLVQAQRKDESNEGGGA